MARVLHLVKGADALPLAVIARERAAGDDVRVAVLPGGAVPPVPEGVPVQRVPADLGYDALLEAIFGADRVLAW
ncbi:MAG TPA: hypothetical protein VNN07_16320 [Candidatus Tectomicrobia bacterium]|nr:hypothetical protein [Candidatus Tectomicrobia bacterium]